MRKLIAFDGKRWYIRRISVIQENVLANGDSEKIYYCDKPLGKKKGYATFKEIPSKYIQP